jgi:hypothetical protein
MSALMRVLAGLYVASRSSTCITSVCTLAKFVLLRLPRALLCPPGEVPIQVPYSSVFSCIAATAPLLPVQAAMDEHVLFLESPTAS